MRSFLQARGKVNRGIRDTLLNEPGATSWPTTTASRPPRPASTRRTPSGGRAIARIRHLQIVNGGQTTASIHHAVRRERADVSRAYVQAKITIVPEERLEQIVPLISRYANSQNRISEADLTANHPFHVRVEELSRTEWAPATDGTQRQTRWFYERARGQYADALAREGTPARQREFKRSTRRRSGSRRPTSRSSRTPGTSCRTSSAAAPRRASCTSWSDSSSAVAVEPDAEYLRALVAKAILFKRTERLVTEQHFGGYRANIVTYAMALLSHHSMQRLDLERIWERQDIDEPTARAIVDLSHRVHDVITDPPGAANVTEYCKREACWQRMRELQITLPQDLVVELLPVGRPTRTIASAGVERPAARGAAGHRGCRRVRRRRLAGAVQLGEGDRQPAVLGAVARLQPRQARCARAAGRRASRRRRANGSSMRRASLDSTPRRRASCCTAVMPRRYMAIEMPSDSCSRLSLPMEIGSTGVCTGPPISSSSTMGRIYAKARDPRCGCVVYARTVPSCTS